MDFLFFIHKTLYNSLFISQSRPYVLKLGLEMESSKGLVPFRGVRLRLPPVRKSLRYVWA